MTWEKQGSLLLTISEDTAHPSGKTWQQVHELACDVASAVRKQSVDRKWAPVTEQGPPLRIRVQRGLVSSRFWAVWRSVQLQSQPSNPRAYGEHFTFEPQDRASFFCPSSLKVTVFALKIQSKMIEDQRYHHRKEELFKHVNVSLWMSLVPWRQPATVASWETFLFHGSEERLSWTFFFYFV